MKNILIITFLLICFIPNTSAQTPRGIIASLDSLDKTLLDKKYFFFGETHDINSETNIHREKLIELLINKGIRKIKLCIENTPSYVYYLQKYYESHLDSASRDESLLSKEEIMFCDTLRQYKDLATFEFIAMDLSSSDWTHRWLTQNFIKDVFESYINTKDMPINYKNRFIPSKKRLLRWAKELASDTMLMASYLKRVSPVGKKYFLQEVKQITHLGLPKTNLSNLFAHKLRDEHMAGILDDLASKLDTNEVIIATFGKAHIAPIDDTTGAVYLIQKLKTIKREDIVVMPIVYYSYKHAGLFYTNYYNSEWQTPEHHLDFFNVTDISEMGKIMKDKAFDAILIHNLDAMWKEELERNRIDAEKEKKKK